MGFANVKTGANNCEPDRKMFLNGEAIYLEVVLDEGYFPASNLTPPSDEAIHYDIRMAADFPGSFIGPTAWACWLRPKWPTLICSMTSRWDR
jgi:hypothetical protein